MTVVDLPRVQAALTELDRLVAAYPELRGEAARMDELVALAAAAGIDAAALSDVAAVMAEEHEADLNPIRNEA